MVDLTEINASYLLHIGKIKEGVGEARKLEVIQDPSLIKQLCDLADPTIKKKGGRPCKKYDADYKKIQFEVYAFFCFRRAWYEYQGAKDPATLAKGDAIEHFNLGISWFEQAHKRFSRRLSYDSHMRFYIDQWLESEPKAPPKWARLDRE
jgi:hypothetical protein